MLKVVAIASCERVQSVLYKQLKGLDFVEFSSVYTELADGINIAQKEHPDVIIIDMSNREMDSSLCIQTLSMDPENPYVIFALHENLDNQVIIQAVQSGAKEFIHYPTDPSALEASLQRYLTILKRSTRFSAMAGPAETEQEGKLVSVFASKGGAGSSTVAVNLAYELQCLTGHKTVLLDMDQWYNNTAVMLGLTPDYSLGDLAENNATELDDDILNRIIVEHDSGLHLVVGSKNILDDNDMVSPDLLDKVVQFLKKNYRYIVVDLPTYVLDFYHNTLVEKSDEVLLVSTLDVPAMYRSCQYLELGRKYYPDISRLKLVMNRWNLKAAYGMSNKNLEDQFNYPVHCRLANDWDLNVEANSRGALLSQVKPKAELVKNIQQLANLVAGLEESAGEKSLSEATSSGVPGDKDESNLIGKLFGGIGKKDGTTNQLSPQQEFGLR